MKRLILIIMGVLLCTPLYADMNTYIIGSGGGGEVTWMLNENAEGTGYDDDSGGEWSIYSGQAGLDNDYADAPLRGLQSIALGNQSGTGECGIIYTFKSAVSECWVHILYKVTDLSVGGLPFLRLRDSSGNVLVELGQNTSQNKIYPKIGGSFVDYADDEISADTTYHIWVHAKKGDGTAEVHLYIGTSTTRPTVDVSETNGTFTADITDILLYGTSTADGFLIIDQILVSGSEFTSVDE